MMKLTGKHYGIVIATLVTAVAHILAALDKQLFPEGVDPLFLLNGLGYLGLLGAYILPIPFFQQQHELVRKGFMIFAIITILAWVWIWVIQYVIIGGENFFAHDSLYGVPAKIAEIILILFLRADKE
ncbi:MAG: hypothetical protein QM730_15555 [Anaerolineales bacterium]